MNGRWVQFRMIPTLLKFSSKTTFPINLPARKVCHQMRSSSLRSVSTVTTAAKVPREQGLASYLPDSGTIMVHFPQTGKSFFPTVWLRDNCQCQECFHQDSQSRTISLLHFNPTLEPKTISADGQTLSIIWSDGHRTSYSFDWLSERSFEPTAQTKWLNEVYRIPRTPWKADDFANILYKTSFDSVMNNDAQLRTWLQKLSEYGVAILTETPKELTCVRRLADRVGFIRRTHYGEEFSVQAKPGTTNVAYLSANLQLHTDLPYYHYKPGVNLLHCLVQATGAANGGDNLLADVLAVAEEFRNNDPTSYKALTTTVVDWNDIGQEDGKFFHKIHRDPVISLDRWGKVERVNFSQPQRDSHFSVPIEDVTPWYNAMAKFVAAIHSKNFCVKYKMEPGDILTFDNTRLVHGRSAYEEKSNRHVLGAYLDWDEIRSRLRVIGTTVL